MLTCEVQPTTGSIVFEGQDITGFDVTHVCQLGLTKSYQVNQLFNRLTVRENITIAALARTRRLPARSVPQRLPASRASTSSVDGYAGAGALSPRGRHAGLRRSPMARSGGWRSGWRSPPNPSLLLLDEPLAGMSPHERAETVRLLKSIARAAP